MPELQPVSQILPGYEVTSFAGMGATGGTPKPIIQKLNRELRAVMAGNEVVRQMTDAGADMRPGSPEEMIRYVTDEIAKWRRVVKERRIEVKLAQYTATAAQRYLTAVAQNLAFRRRTA